MKDSLYTVFYAAALGIVCSLLLTAAAKFTEPYRESNSKAEKMRNILEVLSVPFDENSAPQKLEKVFEKNVKHKEDGPLERYGYLQPGATNVFKTLAFPFEGPGLWGPIKGFLSLKNDLKTIQSISFYEHEETPGLGGEITADWFRNQFKGKSIIGPDGQPGIKIVQNGASKDNEVDAISGATLTSQKVEKMLNTVIKQINKDGK